MQSKRQSVIEISTGIGVGVVGSFLITLAVLHVVKDKWLATTLTVGLCTVWSFVRGYALRRFFNKKAMEAAAKQGTHVNQ